MLQGKHEAAVKSLTWLRPDGTDVVTEAAIIREAIASEREMGSDVGLLDMFKNPIDRRRTVLAVGAVTLQAASGSMFIIGERLRWVGDYQANDVQHTRHISSPWLKYQIPSP